ncbi:Sm-like protein Lsm7/SmG like protein [Aduncisulcus paluster]|uniref:Sm protein G n=1 Tax=Aduncisulcus paluster TaxID=2918883 RepID=A0ABQ5KSE3_9EUKA|nr:Sm-like protein Lsm7/SmG like protein [Aduncisulcus paluster]
MPKEIQNPELTQFVRKRISVKMNQGRMVIGVLDRFDKYLNIVLTEAEEIRKPENPGDDPIIISIDSIFIRGQSIITIEPLDML